MITHATVLDDVSVRRGYWSTGLIAIASSAILYVFDTDFTIVVGCILGALAGLLPLMRQVRESMPKDIDTLMTLSRYPTKHFYVWLAIMVVYLIAGRPLGLEVFEVITGTCVAGLFFSRVAFPAVTIVLWCFYPTPPAPDDGSAQS